VNCINGFHSINIDNIINSVNSGVGGIGEDKEPVPAVTPANAVTVLFMSGSTGTPKCMTHDHAAFCDAILLRCHSRLRHAPLTRTSALAPRAPVLQFATYSFDVSNNDLPITMASGRLHVQTVGACARQQSRRRALRVNLACLTPTVADMLHPAAAPQLRTPAIGEQAVTVQTAGHNGLARCALSTFTGRRRPRAGARRAHVYADDDPDNTGRACSGCCWVVSPDSGSAGAGTGDGEEDIDKDDADARRRSWRAAD
jgi:non-ribosomal peptide synthetase component F